jgi:serine/threonine protein kinase
VVDSYVGSKGAYFVTPYAGKNLEKMRNLVEPQAILQQFRGLVEAAKFANDREVVHRDIKPNNATVNGDGTPCLVDFGICMYDDEVGLTDTWEGFGTRYFAAPECDAGKSGTHWSTCRHLQSRQGSSLDGDGPRKDGPRGL